jgi:hypothetical protein
MECFAILLRIQKKVEVILKLFPSIRIIPSRGNWMATYLQEELTIFNYKRQTYQELVSPKLGCLISRSHMSEKLNILLILSENLKIIARHRISALDCR